MTFRVGMKVCCIDAVGAENLSHGAIYTIKEITPITRRIWRGQIGYASGVLLIEAAPNGGHTSFSPLRFRPIVSRKTSIEIFTAMLTPQGIDA